MIATAAIILAESLSFTRCGVVGRIDALPRVSCLLYCNFSGGYAILRRPMAVHVLTGAVPRRAARNPAKFYSIDHVPLPQATSRT